MREIDLQTWARRNVYGLFSDCDWPFYQVSFPLDVTNLRAYTKKEGLSFYFTLSWLLTKGMEQQEAFLIRIREGRLFVLDELMPSCTVLRPGDELTHDESWTLYADIPCPPVDEWPVGESLRGML